MILFLPFYLHTVHYMTVLTYDSLVKNKYVLIFFQQRQSFSGETMNEH